MISNEKVLPPVFAPSAAQRAHQSNAMSSTVVSEIFAKDCFVVQNDLTYFVLEIILLAFYK